jgi:hypothetical protein
LLHKIFTSLSILVSGLCMLYHNFYCIFSFYLPLTKPGLRYLCWHGLSSDWGFLCGGGVEYLHRSPASRRKRRKGSLESGTVKYGHESHGTGTREWLRWRGPAAIVNDRPERAPHINKPATVWQ